MSAANTEPQQNTPDTQAESQQSAPKQSNTALVLLFLHGLLFFYSLSGPTSKLASREPFMSFGFILWYGAMLAVLAVYAIGWQQVLKRMPLTVAFANKAITVVWGSMWGIVLFGETLKPPMVIGALIVIAGVVLFAIADGEERKAAQAAQAASEEKHALEGEALRDDKASQEGEPAKDAAAVEAAEGIAGKTAPSLVEDASDAQRGQELENSLQANRGGES